MSTRDIPNRTRDVGVDTRVVDIYTFPLRITDTKPEHGLMICLERLPRTIGRQLHKRQGDFQTDLVLLDAKCNW